jgi:hypothetical protein
LNTAVRGSLDLINENRRSNLREKGSKREEGKGEEKAGEK